MIQQKMVLTAWSIGVADEAGGDRVQVSIELHVLKGGWEEGSHRTHGSLSQKRREEEEDADYSKARASSWNDPWARIGRIRGS